MSADVPKRDPCLDPQPGDRVLSHAIHHVFGIRDMWRLVIERTPLSVVYVITYDPREKWIFGKRPKRTGPFMVPLALWSNVDNWRLYPGAAVTYEVGA